MKYLIVLVFVACIQLVGCSSAPPPKEPPPANKVDLLSTATPGFSTLSIGENRMLSDRSIPKKVRKVSKKKKRGVVRTKKQKRTKKKIRKARRRMC